MVCNVDMLVREYQVDCRRKVFTHFTGRRVDCSLTAFTIFTCMCVYVFHLSTASQILARDETKLACVIESHNNIIMDYRISAVSFI